MEKIIALIEADKCRVAVIALVSSLNLPDCYVAAGFIRNLIWDHLHNYSPTPLNDIDVIYFSKLKIDEKPALAILTSTYPHIKWQLKNQAEMHERNGDHPYTNSIDAMAHWPEIETAIGARLATNGEIIVESPFQMESIFNGFITHNPKRNKEIFLKRIEEKEWLTKWPALRIKPNAGDIV